MSKHKENAGERKQVKRSTIVISIISVLLIAILVGIVVLYSITSGTTLDSNKLKSDTSRLQIYDNRDEIISNQQGNYYKYDEISPYIRDAFVALEDKRFYEHNGLDYRRIAGAIVNNIKAKGFKEGASTITQQLIKNTHLTSEKTIVRKLNEAKLAKLLEKEYSKDEILEMYLNVIYFGSSVYGVGDATAKFYGKKPNEVTLSEAAVIAGVVKSPKNYSPIINYDNSMDRRNLVLKVMLDNEFIAQNAYNQALEEKITLKNTLIEKTFSKKYCSEAIVEATAITGLSEKELINSGYSIKTYMDSTAQKSAYDMVTNTGINPNNANIVNAIIDNNSGGIKAYHSNISISAREIIAEAGSTLKPFSVYAQAIEQGLISPSSKILDEPININGYSPSNYNNVFHGYVSARAALANSYNIPAVKLMNDIGINSSSDMLRKFGFNLKETDENLSLALGCLSTSPLSIATAYSAIANGGRYRQSAFVREITNNKGKIIYSNNKSSSTIISRETAYLLTDMLMASISNGTCSKLSSLPYNVAAKSGTVAAKDNLTKDAWCAAYTTADTAITWHGAKSNNYLPKTYGGGGLPTISVRNMLNAIYSSNIPSDFDMPQGVGFYPIDRSSYEGNNIIVLGNDMSYGDIFSRFHAPKHDDSITINPVEPSIEAYPYSNYTIITMSNLVVGRDYKLLRKSGFLGRYEVIKEFTATSTTMDYMENNRKFKHHRYKIE